MSSASRAATTLLLQVGQVGPRHRQFGNAREAQKDVVAMAARNNRVELILLRRKR